MAEEERRSRGAGPKVPGIREIARALGVSIGTVDRALHDRPGISPQTRARVLGLVRTLGYRPDPAARYLSSRKELKVAVALPLHIASFWDVVRDAIRSAARPLERTGVRLLERPYPRLGEGETEALEECLEREVDGLLIAPGDPERLEPLIARASARRIPVACIDTDAPTSARLTAVGVDPIVSGSLVGELMGRFLRGQGAVVVVTGLFTTLSHAQKLEGFRQALAELWPGLELAEVVEAHDDEAEAYRKCRDVLAGRPEVAGVYVSTANSVPVLRAIADAGRDGKLTVITTDLFPALCPHIASGSVTATIHQRPWTQGRIAFQALHGFLVEGVVPAPLVSLSPQIVMRSNLPLFLERMRPAWARARESVSTSQA